MGDVITFPGTKIQQDESLDLEGSEEFLVVKIEARNSQTSTPERLALVLNRTQAKGLMNVIEAWLKESSDLPAV